MIIQFKYSLLIFLICYIIAVNPTFVKSQQNELIAPDEKLSIPMEYDGQFIMIKMRINDGMLLNFIVDTGAENLILFKKSIADIHGLTYTQEIPIYGSDFKISRYAYVSPYVSIDLGQDQPYYVNLLVFKEDEMGFDHYAGRRIDGIIGGQLLSRYKLRLDFKRKKLSFYGSEFPIPKIKDYRLSTIEVIKKKPYMKVQVAHHGKTTEKKLLIDSGAGINGLFIVDSTENIEYRNEMIYGIIGKSINGPILGYQGRVERIENEVISMNNPVISYQEIDSLLFPRRLIKRDGLLGNHVLKDYDVVIDYRGKKAYFKRVKKRKTWKYDRSGLNISASGLEFDHFRIDFVVKGSPADEAGFRVGDEIKSINYMPTRFMSLAVLNRKLQRENRKKVRFKIERDGKIMRKELILRDL